MPKNRDETAEILRRAIVYLRTHNSSIRSQAEPNRRFVVMDAVEFQGALTMLEEALASSEGRMFPKPLGAR